jgi:hypothetical protein
MRFFETPFIEDADEFIAKLDAKIFYNIDLAEQTNAPKLFKKLQLTFGTLEQSSVDYRFDFSPFGTRRTINRHR